METISCLYSQNMFFFLVELFAVYIIDNNAISLLVVPSSK